MSNKLVNISVNVPELYLDLIEMLVKQGKVENRSVFVRDALEHYIEKDEVFAFQIHLKTGDSL